MPHLPPLYLRLPLTAARPLALELLAIVVLLISSLLILTHFR